MAGDFEWNAVHSDVVDAKGVEPSTSAMRMQHSPN